MAMLSAIEMAAGCFPKAILRSARQVKGQQEVCLGECLEDAAFLFETTIDSGLLSMYKHI